MRFGLGLAMLLTATACTTGDEPRSASTAGRGDQCFRAASVNSFSPVGRDAVDVRVSAERIYRLDVGPGCFDVDWANRVALRSRTGGYICGAADAELIVPSLGGQRRDRCTVLGVRRLSPEEIEASRTRHRN
jgi:hypothetical protein